MSDKAQNSKISHETLLPIAVQLFLATPKNKIDSIDADNLAKKWEKQVDNFVKFYFRLRDKLEAGE